MYDKRWSAVQFEIVNNGGVSGASGRGRHSETTRLQPQVLEYLGPSLLSQMYVGRTLLYRRPPSGRPNLGYAGNCFNS